MTTNWQRIEEIFAEAVILPSAARAAFIETASAGDTGLCAEVESMLRSHEIAGDFLEEPLFELAEPKSFESRSRLQPGQSLGNYRIISLIGEGGMGEVYLARDTELDREVAIKLVKHGVGTAEIARHLRQEARILAGLNDPHIARLYGGAFTPEGVPYFVMEYVEGERLDDYCERRRLTTNERVALFRKVCSAVAHAHQHLVIHRDLKPGNIRVTPDGEPKLLDFGIARLLDPTTTRAAVQTATLRAFMTPDYASPEQVNGEAMTTASDVYSLGVVLYELLAGQRPYRLRHRAPNDIARLIREAEPVRPSQHRKELRGDLDNILLKALRKEPARRYLSVGQFSEDLGRYLAGRPVSARRDTLAYRTLKFVRRNKLGVAAAAVIVLSLAGGVIATWRQGRIATEERDRARSEAEKAERTTEFLQDTLAFADPGWFSPSQGKGPSATVGEALAYSAQRAETVLQLEPEVLSRVLFTIGTAYRNLGQFSLSEKFLRRALDLHEKTNRTPNARLANLRAGLGELYLVEGRYREAEVLLNAALAFDREGAAHDPAFALSLGAACNDLGLLNLSTGHPAEAESLLRAAVQLAPKIPDRLSVAIWTMNLGRARAAEGDLHGAEQLTRAALAEYRKLPGPRHVEEATGLTILGSLLQDEGQGGEAELTLREAIELSKKLTGDSSPNVALGSIALSEVLYLKGDYGGAEQAARKALAIAQSMLPEGHLGYSAPLTVLGLALNKTGRSPEAERDLRRALTIRQRVLPQGNWQIASTESALGECLTTEGRYAAAEPLLLRSYADLKASQGPANRRTKEALERLVTFCHASGKAAAAAKYEALLPR